MPVVPSWFKKPSVSPAFSVPSVVNLMATKIEWTDATWNPITGCTKVSEGCRNCYAERVAGRLAKIPATAHRYRNGFGLTLQPADLTKPLHWRKPRRVFVGSMGDLFHGAVPFDYIDKVYAVMAACPQHQFQVLTKRPDRMAQFYNRKGMDLAAFTAALNVVASGMKPGAKMPKFDIGGSWRLPHVWAGTSVEDQATADERIPHLLRCPAAVRYLSCEPLLGFVHLISVADLLWDAVHDRKPDAGAEGANIDRIDWVIAGGESGPGSRPAHPEWFRTLRDQCGRADVPFFFKQWGDYLEIDNVDQPAAHRAVDRYRDGTCSPERIRYFDEKRQLRAAGDGCPNPSAVMIRVGKKAAGRRLDGLTHDAFPAEVSA